MLKFKFNGGKFYNDLVRVKEQTKRNVEADSFEIVDIVDRHTRPLVPLETGRLRESIMRRNGMLVEGDFMSQEIEYSERNPKTGFDYALIQHENFEYRHDVGQWMYLTDGMAESENDVIKLFEKDFDLALKETLKGGK